MVGRWNAIDRLSEYHFDTNPYCYVINNPLLYIDPFVLDTLKANEIKPKDWHNFKAKEDVIALNEVSISSNSSNSNSSDNSGLYLAYVALGANRIEEKMFNKNSWYSLRSMRSYSQKFHGNQYEWTKGISKNVSKTMKWAGRGIGAYNFYNINDAYVNQTLQYNGTPMSTESMMIEQSSNLFSTFRGVAGAGWGIGWEIGRGIGGNADYRRNVRPVLQDFLGIERDEYNQRDLRMQEIINNIK